MTIKTAILINNSISFENSFDKPVVFLEDVPYVIQGLSNSIFEILKDIFFIVRNKN